MKQTKNTDVFFVNEHNNNYREKKEKNNKKEKHSKNDIPKYNEKTVHIYQYFDYVKKLVSGDKIANISNFEKLLVEKKIDLNTLFNSLYISLSENISDINSLRKELNIINVEEITKENNKIYEEYEKNKKKKI